MQKADIKKEVKKMWNAIVRFLRPYRNLDKLMLKPKVEPFLKSHIQMVYLIGLTVLIVLAIIQLRFFPNIFAILGAWFVLLVVFVIFRLACELIVGGQKTTETKAKPETKAETKAKK